MSYPIVFFDISGPSESTLRSFYASVFNWWCGQPGPFNPGNVQSLGGHIRQDPNEMLLYIGEANVWQRRYWEQCIRDEADLLAHIDYVHNNPVKHGYADNAYNWPYSTVRRFGEQGLAL